MTQCVRPDGRAYASLHLLTLRYLELLKDCLVYSYP
jgi:hypothetical protein